jgi:hypothetical protein
MDQEWPFRKRHMPASQNLLQPVLLPCLFVLPIGHEHSHRFPPIRDDNPLSATDASKVSCEFVP